MYGPDLKSNQAKVGLQTLVTVTAGQREEESDQQRAAGGLYLSVDLHIHCTVTSVIMTLCEVL